MLPVSTLAALIFFAPLVLTYFAKRALALWKLRHVPSETAEGDQDGQRLLRAGGELGLLALVTWLCENRPLFEHDVKVHDMDFFIFIIAVAFGVALLFSIHIEPKDQGILNRDQSEEWRGFMQMVFLLYHYFALEEVYPLIRLFISCYVFLTGFGNTSFFYLKRDYSLGRFLSMLWRLGFSCMVLSIVHDNPIILYYIVPLHTFYFLVAFVTMVIFERQINYTKNGLRFKLVVLGFILYACWEFPEVFNVVFSFLSDEQHPGAPVGAYGTRYEWQFRSGLDHYSAFFGMVFASAFPLLEMRETEVVSKSMTLRGILALIFGLLLLAWCAVLFPLPKLDFNARHAYSFMFPMCGYLFLRNLTPYLRRVHLSMFAFAGKYTLETYLLQHHVWLTSNAKTVLVLIPGMPKLNFAIVSILYFLLSMKLFHLTLDLKTLLIPSDNIKATLMNLTLLSGSLGACFVLAQILVLTGAASIVPLILAIIGGVSTVFALWLARAAKHSSQVAGSSSSAARAATILFSVSFVVFGLICASFPAQLPPGLVDCNVNNGNWVQPFNRACGQSPQTTYAYCSSRAWTWSVIEQRTCGWKRFTKLEGPFDKVVLIGAETHFALALARVDDAKFLYSAKNPVSEFAQGKVVLRTAKDGISGLEVTKSTVIVCQDAEAVEVCKGVTNGITISLVSSEATRNFVDVSRLKSTAPASDKLESDVYADDVYAVAVQLILNVASRKLKEPGKATLKPPGGIASNPLWGAMFLAVAFLALFMGDGYLGLVGLFSRIFRMEGKMSRDDIMERVHGKVPGLEERSQPTAVTGASGSTSVPPADPEADDEPGDTAKLIVPNPK